MARHKQLLTKRRQCVDPNLERHYSSWQSTRKGEQHEFETISPLLELTDADNQAKRVTAEPERASGSFSLRCLSCNSRRLGRLAAAAA